MSRSFLELMPDRMNDEVRYFRNNIIELHKTVKQLYEQLSSSPIHPKKYKQFVTIIPVLNENGLRFSSHDMACAGNDEKTICTTFPEFFDQKNNGENFFDQKD